MRKLPTGEPHAGKPLVRFGGRGELKLFPTPIEAEYMAVDIARSGKVYHFGGFNSFHGSFTFGIVSNSTLASLPSFI